MSDWQIICFVVTVYGLFSLAAVVVIGSAFHHPAGEKFDERMGQR
jgi:hypothetical protein